MSSFGGNGSGSAAVAPPPQNVRPPAGRIVRAPGPRSSRRTSKSRSPAGSIGNRDQRRASPARSASQPRPKDDKASNANQNRKVRPAGAKQAKAKRGRGRPPGLKSKGVTKKGVRKGATNKKKQLLAKKPKVPRK